MLIILWCGRNKLKSGLPKPLKHDYQQLKENITCKYYSIKSEIEIEEKNPLKQGLKHFFLHISIWHCIIEEKNPLKQGLKLAAPAPHAIFIAIEEKNPLRQGLKPSALCTGSR